MQRLQKYVQMLQRMEQSSSSRNRCMGMKIALHSTEMACYLEQLASNYCCSASVIPVVREIARHNRS